MRALDLKGAFVIYFYVVKIFLEYVMPPELIIALSVLGGVILLCAAVFFGGVLYAYITAFRFGGKGDPYLRLGENSDVPDAPRCRELVTNILAIPYERVYTSSRDGLKLGACYYHNSDGAPVEIYCHGFHSVGVRDFSGIALIGRECGRNQLFIDQRAHNGSEGKTVTYGIKERFDLLCWIEYVRERFGADTKIILFGVSMGGATVLMASGEDLPKNVCGIVADCPYSRPDEIIIKVATTLNPLLRPFIVKPLIYTAARLSGFKLGEVSAEEAVKKATVPIMIIHGDEDDFVPFYMGERIAKANPDIKFEVFRAKFHGLSYIADTERYVLAVREFTTECLEGKNEIK